MVEVCFAEEVVTIIVDGGAVPALVKHLQAPPGSEVDTGLKPFEHEVEKGSAFALGLLAVKVCGICICICSLYALWSAGLFRRGIA